nr:MAG TPA: hypothetical protein [Caudoviricetes sp.]
MQFCLAITGIISPFTSYLQMMLGIFAMLTLVFTFSIHNIHLPHEFSTAISRFLKNIPQINAVALGRYLPFPSLSEPIITLYFLACQHLSLIFLKFFLVLFIRLIPKTRAK